MKTWRSVSLISVIIGLLAFTFIFTTPLRYPGFIFFWRPIMIFLIPLVVIVGILPLRLRWSHSRFSKMLFISVLLFLGLSAFGYMAWPILAVSLLALLGMFIASRTKSVTAR